MKFFSRETKLNADTKIPEQKTSVTNLKLQQKLGTKWVEDNTHKDLIARKPGGHTENKQEAGATIFKSGEREEQKSSLITTNQTKMTRMAKKQKTHDYKKYNFKIKNFFNVFYIQAFDF